MDNMHTPKIHIIALICLFKIYKYRIVGGYEWDHISISKQTVCLQHWHYCSMQLSWEFIAPHIWIYEGWQIPQASGRRQHNYGCTKWENPKAVDSFLKSQSRKKDGPKVKNNNNKKRMMILFQKLKSS